MGLNGFGWMEVKWILQKTNFNKKLQDPKIYKIKGRQHQVKKSITQKDSDLSLTFENQGMND